MSQEGWAAWSLGLVGSSEEEEEEGFGELRERVRASTMGEDS